MIFRRKNLWLPDEGIVAPKVPWSVFPSRRNIQKWGQQKCCCTPSVPPACTCTLCDTDQNGVPCCLSVTLSGLSACTYLNDTWAVRWRSDCTWSCDIPSFCTGCGDVTLAVVIDAGKVTASVGAYSWEADQGDCSLSISSMTLLTSGGGASPTCTIAPKSTAGCVCACDITCARCAGGDLAGYLEVTISGMVDQNCSLCNDCNGTYIIPLKSCALWEMCYSTPDLCVYGEDSTCTGFYVSVELLTGTTYVWEVQIGTCITTEGSCTHARWDRDLGSRVARDCVNIDLTIGPADLIVDSPHCDFSAVTIAITAIGDMA